MDRFTIRLLNAEQKCCCPLCGQSHQGFGGFGLFADAYDDPMCRACGKKLAPTMIALLELAQTAERVGRGSRHLLTPPMESLLDLARAAENYSSSR